MQTYTFQLTGIKGGNTRSMYITTYAPETNPSVHPLLIAGNRARQIFHDYTGVFPYTWQHLGDAIRWFEVGLQEPGETSDVDLKWFNSVDTDNLWAHFSG
jgi:hypothetical protein